ncbi:methyltransferase family protein [Methanobacterium paludis]|uniref:Isoprenylcysteine carboxyl methyltransferase n=1 Tax=Methanobacterium paludis (strain DSM 25820 / JCM 18151 / SWAN1) TaxID=868131 RepID=F6D6F2_METPW|nr:methyltransferase [Methanobacterium paludis]AEG19385.1 Isoprenylcysteine carboxyl methyltransferase [Methanobacterium paludis]
MENQKTSKIKLFLTFIYILIFPVALLFISGNWLWIQGWVFSIWFIGLCYTTIIYLYRYDPALLEERYRQPGSGEEKRWDKYFMYILFPSFVIWFLIMSLDAQRFAWTINFPIGLEAVGLILLIGSAFFLFRSYKDNTFVSPLVRIQSERDQKVVSTGVYGFVRHPMYLGGILLFLGAPLLLGSVYGLIVGIFLSLLFVARITGEEKMLLEELEGYPDYKKKVKYRLIPYIW